MLPDATSTRRAARTVETLAQRLDHGPQLEGVQIKLFPRGDVTSLSLSETLARAGEAAANSFAIGNGVSVASAFQILCWNHMG